MKARLISSSTVDYNPLFVNGQRGLLNYRIAGKTLEKWICLKLEKEGIEITDDASLCICTDYLPDIRDISALAEAREPAILMDRTKREDRRLAWNHAESNSCDCKIISAQFATTRLQYPWDLLDFQQQLLQELQSRYHPDQVSPQASILGVLQLGDNSIILPGVVTEGHVVIGENCKIGPNCYIRGTTSIGNNCIVGQSVEIKSSLIGDDTFISHLTYVGDSIIGSQVNFGAGSVCSNYRHDGANHRVMLADALIDSGRDKLGAIIGDNVKLGCHTVIYPGRIISANHTTLPGQIVSRNID